MGLSKVSQLTMHIRAKNQAMTSKELPAELRDSIVSSHRSGAGYRTICAALKVPESTAASITLKWKKFMAEWPDRNLSSVKVT